MRRIILSALLLTSVFTTYAKDKKPKIDIKDDTVTIDKNAEFILEPIKQPKFEARQYYIKDLSNKKIALIQSDCYEDPTRPNPNRYKYQSAPAYLNTCYSTITFLNDKKTAEFTYRHKSIHLAEFLIESGLIKNGSIAQEDEDEFVLIHGNKESEEKAQKLGGNTIIINNNTITPPGNGVNFNVGQ